MADFGLLPSGFLKKSYTDILKSIENKFKAIFGDEIIQTAESPLGTINRVFSDAISELWEVAEGNNTFDLRYAQGMQLDYLANQRGISRKQERKSTSKISISGQAGGQYLAGHLFTSTNGSWALDEEITLDLAGYATGTVTAVEAGAITAEIGEINNITDPVSPQDKVTNYEVADIGGLEESDDELRRRLTYPLSSLLAGNTIGDSLTAKLEQLTGVSIAKVVYNETNEQVGDMPPHSERVIVGGNYNPQVVAETILNDHAWGISMVGNNEVIVNYNGQCIPVYFDEACKVYAQIDVVVRNVKSECCSNKDFAEMKRELLNYGRSLIGGCSGELGGIIATKGFYSIFEKYHGLEVVSIKLSRRPMLLITQGTPADDLPTVDDGFGNQIPWYSSEICSTNCPPQFWCDGSENPLCLNDNEFVAFDANFINITETQAFEC